MRLRSFSKEELKRFWLPAIGLLLLAGVIGTAVQSTESSAQATPAAPKVVEASAEGLRQAIDHTCGEIAEDVLTIERGGDTVAYQIICPDQQIHQVRARLP